MSKVVPKRTATRAAIVAGALAFGAGGTAAANCEGLAGKNFGDVTISTATSVAPPFNVAGKETEFGHGQFIFKLDDGYFAASEKRTDGQAVGF